MDYKRIYDLIINNALNREVCGYTETHHIKPRCLGGTDDNKNLVKLTAREHFVCHLLLVKIYPQHLGLVRAANMMCTFNGTHKDRSNNRLYEWVRVKLSESMSQLQTGEGNSQYGTYWIHNTELKKSKKIPIGENIPEGWVKGRKIKFDVFVVCTVCERKFKKVGKKVVCSPECLKESHRRRERNRTTKKKCSIDGVIYSSVSEAANKLEIGNETLRMRIKSNSFPNCFYCV